MPQRRLVPHDTGAVGIRGCRRDNIFVERLWRTIEYEEVYLHACATVSEARAGISRYLTLRNTRRRHSRLGELWTFRWTEWRGDSHAQPDVARTPSVLTRVTLRVTFCA